MPAPPPQNHVEEGVSNLADIVKGKRLKDGGGVNAIGTNCLPEKQSKGGSQVVAKVQPSSQASQPPRPPRSDARVRVDCVCAHWTVLWKNRFIHCTYTFPCPPFPLPLPLLPHSFFTPPLLLPSFLFLVLLLPPPLQIPTRENKSSNGNKVSSKLFMLDYVMVFIQLYPCVQSSTRPNNRDNPNKQNVRHYSYT